MTSSATPDGSRTALARPDIPLNHAENDQTSRSASRRHHDTIDPGNVKMAGRRVNGPGLGTGDDAPMQETAKHRRRARVERGIYKRTGKDIGLVYEVCYSDSDGRQRWRTVDRLQEARALRGDLVSKVARGERIAPTKVTLAQYADEWLLRQETRLRPKTYDLYSSYLRLHIKPRLGRRRLQAITVNDVAALIVSMQKGERYRTKEGVTSKTTGKPFAAWTIRGVLVVLGRVFGAALRDGTIQVNPVRRLEKGERPATDRREFPSLDPAAIGKLISATPERYRTLVAVSILTGLRQSEALGLRWRDVDTKTGVIRVRHQLDRHQQIVEPKTKAAKRDVPIAPSLGRLLAEQKEQAFARGLAKPTDFVFSSETGGPLHYRNVARRGLDKALTTSGLPRLRWHDLRHVAASALIAQRTDPVALARMLGHSNPSITMQTYAHEFNRARNDDQTRNSMEAAFAGMLSQ